MSHIPRAICGECNLEMRCVKVGVCLEMVLPDGESYYKIQADRYGCKRCGKTDLVGFAVQPLAHNFEDDYEKLPADLQAQFA